MQDQEPDSPEVSTPESPYPPPKLSTKESTATPDNELDIEAPRNLVIWNNKTFEVVITQYIDSKNTCIVLLNPDTLTIEAKASVNLAPLPPYLVYIKDYSENRGIAAVLEKARYLRRTGNNIRNGSEDFGQYEILDKLGRGYGISIPETATPPEVDPNFAQDTQLDGRAATAEEDNYPDPV